MGVSSLSSGTGKVGLSSPSNAPSSVSVEASDSVGKAGFSNAAVQDNGGSGDAPTADTPPRMAPAPVSGVKPPSRNIDWSTMLSALEKAPEEPDTSAQATANMGKRAIQLFTATQKAMDIYKTGSDKGTNLKISV